MSFYRRTDAYGTGSFCKKNIWWTGSHGEYLAVGPDFRFGYQRKGTPQLLKELGEKYGFRTEILEKEKYKDKISAVRISGKNWIRDI